MRNNIRISPKHGVNATIPCCFFCKQPKEGEIALLGRLPGKEDKEAGMYSIIDFEPCEKCKAYMVQGITLLGVSKTPLFEGQPPLSLGKYQIDSPEYLTDQYLVIKEEALSYFIQDEDLRKEILTKRKAYIEAESLEQLGACKEDGQTEKEEQEE